jgi:pimeloyl-ACP methyl ester carboxylesterase
MQLKTNPSSGLSQTSMETHIQELPHPDGILDMGGLKVHYLQCGSASQNVLVLHGWGGSIDSVRCIVDDLQRDYRVIALDLPGHGQSGLPPEPWTVGDYAACVLEVLRRLGVSSCFVVGHSFGARIAIKLAASHPGLLQRIALVNAAGVRLPPTGSQKARTLLGTSTKGIARYLGSYGPRFREFMTRLTASSDYLAAGELRPTFSKVVQEDLTPLLAKVLVPTLLVWGDGDRDTPLTIGLIMNKHIPNSELVVLQHAGHFSYIDQFGQFRLLLRRFLRVPQK